MKFPDVHSEISGSKTAIPCDETYCFGVPQNLNKNMSTKPRDKPATQRSNRHSIPRFNDSRNSMQDLEHPWKLTAVPWKSMVGGSDVFPIEMVRFIGNMFLIFWGVMGVIHPICPKLAPMEWCNLEVYACSLDTQAPQSHFSWGSATNLMKQHCFRCQW